MDRYVTLEFRILVVPLKHLIDIITFSGEGLAENLTQVHSSLTIYYWLKHPLKG